MRMELLADLKLRNIAMFLVIGLITSACNRPPDADTLATVNGKNIAAAELDKYYKAQTAGAPPQENGESVDSVKLAILDQLIEKEVLLQRADKLGLTATQDEVDAKLNEIKAPYTKEQFGQKLKEQGLTEDDFQRDLRQNLTIQKLFNKEITSHISISDKDVTDFYNANKTGFNFPQAPSAGSAAVDEGYVRTDMMAQIIQEKVKPDDAVKTETQRAIQLFNQLGIKQ